jgi:hypothetical protein
MVGPGLGSTKGSILCAPVAVGRLAPQSLYFLHPEAEEVGGEEGKVETEDAILILYTGKVKSPREMQGEAVAQNE